MAHKKAILAFRKLVHTFGLDFEEAQALTTYQLFYYEFMVFVHLTSCESLCLLKILAKDRLACKKAILVA
jgi:hypothetical protein